jgi:PqqD family protein of HPr-rel-A system
MQKLSHLALNEEGFVFNPLTGDSFQASETGLRILKAFRDGADDAEAARRLAEEFDVAPEEAQRDVADFRSVLKSLGLVSG